MPKAIRIFLAVAVFMMVTVFCNLLASLLPESLQFLGLLIPWIIAFLAARLVWRRSESVEPGGLFTSILTGALTLGALGFTLGFLGPMLFAPDANQGPLLGIFITGPAGLVLGAALGALWWWRLR